MKNIYARRMSGNSGHRLKTRKLMFVWSNGTVRHHSGFFFNKLKGNYQNLNLECLNFPLKTLKIAEAYQALLENSSHLPIKYKNFARQFPEQKVCFNRLVFYDNI